MLKAKSSAGILPYISDQRFRSLVEKSSDVILLMDRRGKILYATPSIVRLYGREPHEFVGVSSFSFIHPFDIPRVMKELTTLLLRPDKDVSVECRIKHKNNSWHWVEATGSNFLKDSTIKAIVVNFRDITERKKLEERKDEFIGMASHELRTPLSALKTYLELLKRKGTKNPEDFQKIVSRMSAQVEKMNELIATLLDVSRMQEGKIRLQKTKVILSDVITDVVSDFRLTSTRRIMTRNLSRKKVYVDQQRIAQVLENLLTNAIKYSPEKSTITIWCTSTPKEVFVHVKDEGRGIAKENLEQIFTRFFQEQNTSDYQGLGLGLYITAAIIQLHHGSISVQSEIGKGSTFTFSLPLDTKE